VDRSHEPEGRPRSRRRLTRSGDEEPEQKKLGPGPGQKRGMPGGEIGSGSNGSKGAAHSSERAGTVALS